MGQAGAGSFNQLINGVLNNSDKMQSLQNFFEVWVLTIHLGYGRTSQI